MKLLLVEDDAAMRAVLQRALVRRGFVLTACAEGKLALREWASQPPDAVLLDLSLPDLDGLDVLAQARAQGLSTPVLLLTARGTVGDRVQGLNAGADDYLPKPFDLDELEARVRALLRRAPHAASGVTPSAPDLELGPLRLARGSGAVYFAQQALDLPPRELILLRALMQRGGQAVAKERLLEQVFVDDPNVLPEAIEVVVYRLRKRLAATGVELVTLRGLGYLLRVR